MQMIPIAMALAHLHIHGIVHGHVHPVRPTLLTLRLTDFQFKTVIRIKEDGNATLTHIGAHTVASQILHYFPNQESFTWQAP